MPVKLIFILFLLAFAVHAQERVAILNTVDDLDSIGFSDLAYLTNRLRETAVNVLPKQRYGVMTTESIIAFLGSQENARKVCNESSCLAEVGRKVSADYVAQARVGRFGEQLSINFQLYSVKSGNLIGSFTGNSSDIFGLLAIIDEKAPVLFKQMLEESTPPKIEPSPEVEKPVEVEKPEFEKPASTSFWVALGLDVLGVALIVYGITEDGNMVNYRNEYREAGHPQSYYDDVYKKAEDSRSNRNMLYVLGSLVLASGIGVHIWF